MNTLLRNLNILLGKFLVCVKLLFLAYYIIFSLGIAACLISFETEEFDQGDFDTFFMGTLLLASIFGLVDYIFRKKERKEASFSVMGIFRIVIRAQCYLVLSSFLVSACIASS